MDPFDPPKKVGIAGDWHANYRHARFAVMQAAEHGVTHILHTGDFGWLFQESFIADLEQTLAKYGIHILFVDGNHEDHDYLDALEDPQITPHIRHIRRGEYWEWDGLRFVGLGGAHSVDRPSRKPGVSWWPQELIGYQDCEKIAAGGRADIMITHDCPSGVEIPGIAGNPYGFHPQEIRMSEDHRDLLATLVDVVQPKMLFHGHYHVRYTDVLDVEQDDTMDGFQTIVHGLDMDGAVLRDNMVFATLDQLARGEIEKWWEV